MKPMSKNLKAWFPLAAAITVLSGLIYLTVQQDMRMFFNDPQIGIAEDAARDLAAGADATAVMALYAAAAPRPVDIAQSLSYYLMIFDENGAVLGTSAVLDGQAPSLPPGVLDYTRVHGEDRITWQPRPGVRQAVVVVHYGGAKPGFVMSGANMRELEIRESNLLMQVAAGWGAAMILSLLAAMFWV